MMPVYCGECDSEFTPETVMMCPGGCGMQRCKCQASAAEECLICKSRRDEKYLFSPEHVAFAFADENGTNP